MNAAQSAPGSTYGGAGSPKGLTEGVSCVIMRCCFFSQYTPSASRSLSSSPKGGAKGALHHVRITYSG